MIRIRKSRDRGHANREWLDSRFTFSFADYYDPEHTGFRALRVINEDHIAPGKGFGPHAHRDMEIITYVLRGRLQHRDSMGEQHIVGPNEVQTMSAGSGVVHSEHNASQDEEVHLIQIWIEPGETDLVPSYQQIQFRPEERRGRLRLLAGPDIENPGTATRIRQNARVYAAEVGPKTVTATLAPDRHAWLQIVRGAAAINGRKLETGDGAAVSDEPELTISGVGTEDAEFLFFDLA